MSKIPNLFNQNPLVISQGLHRQDWNGKRYNVAIDFACITDLLCPFDGCEVKTYSNSDQGQQSYFTINLPDGSMIIAAHGFPVRTGRFNKGEIIGKCRWHHWHISIVVNGVFDCIMSYLDRSIPTITHRELYNGNTNHPDGRFSSYPDKRLNIGQPAPPQALDTSVKLVTVKYGDGLIQVAKNAGLPFTNPDGSDNYQVLDQIAILNGYPNWRPLHDSLTPGQLVRVRPDDIKPIIQPQPTIPIMPTISMPEVSTDQSKRLDHEKELLKQEIEELKNDLEFEKESKKDLEAINSQLGPVKKTGFILPQRLRSRKLWTAIVAVSFSITAVYKPELQEVLTEVWTITLGYIGIEGVNDIIKANKK